MAFPNTAAALPLPQANPAAPDIPSAAGDGTALVLPNIPRTQYWREQALNPMIAQVENLLNQVGVGVLSGLALSTVASLNLPIAAGVVNIGGPVAYPGGSYAVPDNINGSNAIFVWLQRQAGSNIGAPIHTLTTSAPAGQPAAFIGMAQTSGGVVTAVDVTNGVVRFKSGIQFRQTADPGVPTDSPPAGVMCVTKTAFARFMWDGGAYTQIDAMPVVAGDPTQIIAGMVWFRSDQSKIIVAISGTQVQRESNAFGVAGSPSP